MGIAGDEAANAHRAAVKRHAKAMELDGHMYIEKFLLRDYCDNAHHPDYHVLRHEPSPAHLHRHPSIFYEGVNSIKLPQLGLGFRIIPLFKKKINTNHLCGSLFQKTTKLH